MMSSTAAIINIASSENGKILITEDMIRLSFGSKEIAFNFLKLVLDLYPSVEAITSPATSPAMMNVDIVSPELVV